MAKQTSDGGQSRRIIRELTASEKQLLAKARQKAVEDRAAILSEAKLRKLAAKSVAVELCDLMDKMRKRREELGLSLADVEARTGIQRSALSRLENGGDTVNPTWLTLQRYALAIGMSIRASLHKNT